MQLQSGGCTRLQPEALQEPRIERRVQREQLQRDPSSELLVVGQEDDAHPAAPELPIDHVVLDPLDAEGCVAQGRADGGRFFGSSALQEIDRLEERTDPAHVCGVARHELLDRRGVSGPSLLLELLQELAQQELDRFVFRARAHPEPSGASSSRTSVSRSRSSART